MNSFKIALWQNAKQAKAFQRQDILVTNFKELSELFNNAIPVANKTDQKLITRKWQESRQRDNGVFEPPYLITLDYDSTLTDPEAVHSKLKKHKINHFIFTTWTHKTISTPQKQNDGKNCFKVMLEVNAFDDKELFGLTKALGSLTGKSDINRSDDISSGIFLGGVHPEHVDDFKFYYYEDGLDVETTKKYLEKHIPEEVEIKKDPLDDFEMWEKTAGQKYTPERIKRALATIKYEEVEGFTKMQLWYSIGYALHSTGESDFFELWDEWCLDNCSEEGVYNREENEKFWAKEDLPTDTKHVCTLATLWHLEKLFKARETTSEVVQTPWTFFDKYALEEPEPVKFLIKDLLVEDSIGFLVGTGGVGKSSMCLEIAKAVSSGGYFFGDKQFPTMQGTVAIINKEDSSNKVHNQIHNLIELDIDRLVKSKQTDFSEFEDEGDYIVNNEDLHKIHNQWQNVARPQWAESGIRLTNQDGEDLDALGAVISSLRGLQENLLELNKPKLKLIIFDPLNMYHGGDQNSQRDMSFIFSAFKQIQKELGCAVLIVHHMNKSKGFSGSHTLRDSGRFMWYLKPMMLGKEESDKFIDFYIEKNNDAKANYTALTFVRTNKGLLDIAQNIGEEDENGEDEK